MSDLLPNEGNAKADVESGAYEAHYQPKAGDTVLDLGAHVGYYTERALKFVGETGAVIAFEPNPVNYQRLVARVGGKTNVFTVNAGAAHSDSRIPFYFNAINSGGHGFFQNGQVSYSHDAIVIDIGYWLRAHNFKPTFVKIDTEGSEMDILTSLFASGHEPPMALEVHSEIDSRAIRTLTEYYGYKMLPEGVTVGVCYLIKPYG